MSARRVTRMLARSTGHRARPVVVLAVALLAGAVGAACAPPLPPAGACSPARPASSGTQTIVVNGVTRSYNLRLPAGYDGTRQAPLLLSFHGWLGTNVKQEAVDRFAEKATPRGYVVVYPAAIGDEFNYFGDAAKPDDHGFTDALVTDLQKRLCIDPHRLYISGHSAGSALVGFYLCKTSIRYAGAAQVSATVPPFVPGILTFCPPEARVSTISFHGTADLQVPYTGGFIAGTLVPIPAADYNVERWAEQNRCAIPGTTSAVGEHVTRIAYGGCEGGRQVVLHSIAGGGHPWPGADYADDPVQRDTQGTSAFVPASDQILEFFDQVALPPA